MDGGLSHLRCGKYNFIFVFSNNYDNKKMFVKGFHPLLWSRNQCVCLEKIKKNNNKVNCFETFHGFLILN